MLVGRARLSIGMADSMTLQCTYGDYDIKDSSTCTFSPRRGHPSQVPEVRHRRESLLHRDVRINEREAGIQFSVGVRPVAP